MLWKQSQETDERALVRRTVHGDHQAFQALVLRYEPRLLTYLIHMLRDEENARDILQETFISAFRALPRWIPPDSARAKKPMPDDEYPLAPWLYRIATNCALNFLQKSSMPKISLHLLTEGSPSHALSKSEPIDPAQLVENQYATRELLQEALRQLPPEEAACLIFRFVSGERYTEIAQRMGLTPEAVRKRVTRSIQALRAAYQELEVSYER